jgi:hypothetical protein
MKTVSATLVALTITATSGAHVLAQTTGQCDPRQSPALFALGTRYKLCLVREAKAYEPSGESADNIATAAVVACLKDRRALSDGMAACIGEGRSMGMMDNLDVTLRPLAIQAVVEVRAARHSRR